LNFHRKCRAIVALGAAAGLSVAMFGSMFPMPRVSFSLKKKLDNKSKSDIYSIITLGDLCHGQ
jgi:hypothetical protein